MIDDYGFFEAHKYSSNNKPSLSDDKKCGCFYCLNIFNPSEIKKYIKDNSGTAVCPYCGVDSVIGESSGYHITKEFLKGMYNVWFNDGLGLEVSELSTIFGKLKIFVDEKEKKFTRYYIEKDKKNYPDVDAVYGITVNIEPDGNEHKLEVKIIDCKFKSEICPDERFEAVSFYGNNGKLTLGCEASFGDYEEYGFDYDGVTISNGIEIYTFKTTKTYEFKFGICQIKNVTPENDIQTWLGADPFYW